MLLLVAVVLAVAWLLGFSVYHVSSFAIHILLLAAVISIVLHFVRAGFGAGTGRRSLI